MKKLFLLAILLGLSGCGDNNQNDTSPSDTQTTQLQTTDLAVPITSNYKLAASSLMMSPAISPLSGWSITNSTVMGASTLIDAVKDSRVSAALITPNTLQVAKVLRGGIGGIALSIAVEQLLGAVDWVMDPDNYQIRYKQKLESKYIYTPSSWGNGTYFQTPLAACEYSLSIIQKWRPDIGFSSVSADDVNCLYVSPYGIDKSFYVKEVNPDYNPDVENTLSLEAVAEQVISNADAGSLDAQVATNAATQNILNDAVQAEPIVQELENNVTEKCDPNTNPNCRKECDPPAGVKFNKVTHYERHGRNPDINVGSHGCMAKTGSPIHWHYDVNNQLPDGRCIVKAHNFGGCGVAL